MSELITSAIATNHDIICLQEHRLIHEGVDTMERSLGEWPDNLLGMDKYSKCTYGGIGILLNKLSYNALANIDIVSKRIMIINFNGNPQTSIIVCYSPTNVCDPTEIENFYENLTSTTRQIPKHNVLIIAGDFNVHLGIQDGFNFALHDELNINGILLIDYILENNVLCLNTLYQKRKGLLWTYKLPNGNKVQLDYIMINKKRKNSSKNCRAF